MSTALWWGSNMSDQTTIRAWGFTDLRIAVHWRDVLGQKLARRQLAVLAGPAPVGHADLIVRHEERLGVEQLVDPPGLVAQDLARAWARSGST